MVANDKNKTFYQYILLQFNRKIISVPSLTNNKKAKVLVILSSLSLWPSKSILAKSKFYRKNQSFSSNNKTYAQASKNNVNNIIKIKDAFPKLPAKKIIEIHNMVNNKKKIKPRINMITKSPFKEQVIILMSTNNLEAIIFQANMHIMNINHLLKNAKSEISADFICFDNKGIIITTNKATIVSDLNFIEKYIKDVDNINLKDISSPYFF